MFEKKLPCRERGFDAGFLYVLSKGSALEKIIVAIARLAVFVLAVADVRVFLRRFHSKHVVVSIYGYDYVFGMEATKENSNVSYGKDKDGKPRDGYDYFLERGSFAEDVKKSSVKSTFPTWKLFLEHPSYDSVWSSRGVEHSLNAVTVPTLSVGGTYDQEDMFGPQEEYSTLEPHDANHQNFLVLGP